MMTKPMTDELSWIVQRTLVNKYFKRKEKQFEVTVMEENNSIQNLSEINKTIELMNDMFSKMRIKDEEKIKVSTTLLKSAGINMPNINLCETVNKSSYIAFDVLTERLGLYNAYERLNYEAMMICMNNIGITLDDLNIFLRRSREDGYWFNIKFNPDLERRINQYLKANEYPQYLEKDFSDGSITRFPIKYKFF